MARQYTTGNSGTTVVFKMFGTISAEDTYVLRLVEDHIRSSLNICSSVALIFEGNTTPDRRYGHPPVWCGEWGSSPPARFAPSTNR